MRRFILLSVLALVATALAASVAWAGSPHFVGTPTATRSGDALTVSADFHGECKTYRVQQSLELLRFRRVQLDHGVARQTIGEA